MPLAVAVAVLVPNYGVERMAAQMAFQKPHSGQGCLALDQFEVEQLEESQKVMDQGEKPEMHQQMRLGAGKAELKGQTMRKVG